MSVAPIRLSVDAALALCEGAAVAAGASGAMARSIAVAAVDAEAEGQPSVGLAHFIDYLDALRDGRIDGKAKPVITRPAPAIILLDACGGAAHPGFDLAFGDLVETAKSFGIALFCQRNAFTCGALGFFVRRLAETGLAAIAATNGPALMAAGGSAKPIYCTNPLAFAAPVEGASPLVIDQASSATAFVKIRQAAEAGDAIPQGWAIDADGLPTTDANAAIKGALLAFGGARGGNIALMVEVLAAGLSGANWSLDAPSFSIGSESPGTGLTIVALSPTLIDPDFPGRLKRQLERLGDDHGVHIPGRAKALARERAGRDGLLVDPAVHQRILEFARPPRSLPAGKNGLSSAEE